MKNSRILLSALTAGILCSTSFGDEGINWQEGILGTWEKCSGDACLTTNLNAGIYSATDNANGAIVTLDRDHTDTNVYGGYAEVGDANGNKISVKGGSNFGGIHGGYVELGNANGNEVTVEVSAETQISSVYGGRTAKDSGKDANNNIVTIKNGTIKDNVIGGNSTQASANNNIVKIENGTINGTVSGGDAKTSANENNVIITGGTITSPINGGKSGSGGEAVKNKVTISNATISGSQIIVGISASGDASENTLIIDSGADIASQYVYAGYGGRNGKAHNNVLVFKGGKISSNTALYGGFGNDSAGNQLIVASPLTAKSVNNFQEYFFALPSDIKGGDIMLELTDKLALKTDDKIGLGTQGNLANLKVGDSVTLINKVDNFKTEMYDPNLKPKYDEIVKSSSGLVDYTYNFTLEQSGEKLNATLKSAQSKANEKAKTLSEGLAGAAAAVVEGGSVVADKGISQAMNQSNKAAAVSNTNKTTDNFGAIGFGANRYQTGSYVDSKSINLVAGVALGQELSYGKLLVGPFVELGYSDYETHNDFSTGHVKGDGISKYIGGGIFARYDWNSYANGHPYVEGSIRFGRNKNSFESSEVGNYDANAFYYGAHVGLGYIVEFQNNSNLDFYAKYFYSHLNGDDVTTNNGANLNLDAVNSHKTRFGARFNHTHLTSTDWNLTPYVGLAWEHEYKGAANATTSGYAIEAPSLEGDSGMAEIGVTIAKGQKGFSADLGLAGYAGKKRGVNGNIMLKYEF